MTYTMSIFLLGACTKTGPNDSTNKNILPLGDSITEGVPFTYRHPLYNMLTEDKFVFDFVGSHAEGGWEYPSDGWDRDNEGHSGWMTQSIQEELPNWLPQYNVDIALIHLGTNDAGEDNIEGSYAAMSSIVDQLRTHNDSVAICIAQILPFGSQIAAEEGEETNVDEHNNFVVNWNSELENLAIEKTTETSPILLVDMYGEFGDADLDDGIHPNQSGSEKMASKWLECISNL